MATVLTTNPADIISVIRCFGFLDFKDPASLNKVIEAGQHIIDGKQV